MKHKVNLDEIAAKNLNCHEEDLGKSKIEGLDAYFYWNKNGRGGAQGVFSENGEMLVASSGVNPNKIIEEFKNGKRN